MSSTIARRVSISVAVATLGVGAAAAPADAQDFVAPSCPGFDVGVTIESAAGNPEQAGPRPVMAGTLDVTLENLEEPGTTYSVRVAGAARMSPGPNGSTIITATGSSIVFLFSTDPGGPATTLYRGRLVTNQSADGVTTIISSTGGTVDLCAALSG
jgi:hypothetical protein